MLKPISDSVKDVLRRGKSDPAKLTFTLPLGQLERKLYQDVAKVLDNYGGKWKTSLKAHLFPDADHLELLQKALADGKTENVKQVTQAFYTPAEIVKQMIRLAKLKPGLMVLEPSAGDGRIAVAAQAKGCKVYCVEKDPRMAKKLEAMGFMVRALDFLDYGVMTKSQNYDRIIMNPPFTKTQDVKHILHAWEKLSPGGILVAIASTAIKFRTTKDHVRLTAIIEETKAQIIDLPAGTFKESGTDIASVILVMTKKS